MDMRLWDFSLEIYRLPGVAPACLLCQDEAGADVNLILFLLWRAVARCRLAEGEIASLDALVAPWREHIVEGLEQAPDAVRMLFGPNKIGKLLLKVSE